MDEFENDDAEINAPLDVRYVILGLVLMILGLITLAFAEGSWKIAGAVIFFMSFPVVTVRKKS